MVILRCLGLNQHQLSFFVDFPKNREFSDFEKHRFS